MNGRVPPRYVPTLTQVVSPTAPTAQPDAETAPAALSGPSQEQLLEQVMRRVDLALERRLREAIAAVVMEQTRSLAPMLRDEVEAVVRQAVAEAFEDELAADRRPRR